MEYEWDETKNARNRRERGIDFSLASAFVWDEAVIVDRSRHADGESRYAAIGSMGGKVHTIIFTWRGGRVRIISFRRANEKEERIYEENIPPR